MCQTKGKSLLHSHIQYAHNPSSSAEIRAAMINHWKRPNTNHGAWKISRICGVTSCWSFPSPALDLSGPTLYFPPEYKKSMCSLILTSLMHMWWRQFIKDSSVRVDVVTSLQKSFFRFFFFFLPNAAATLSKALDVAKLTTVWDECCQMWRDLVPPPPFRSPPALLSTGWCI